MPARKSYDPLPPPVLVVPRGDAEEPLAAQIARGRELLTEPIRSEGELEELRAQRRKWSARNEELLVRLFDNRSLADEYAGGPFFAIGVGGRESLGDQAERFQRDIRGSVGRMEAILERLDLIPEPAQAEPRAMAPTASARGAPRVFLVHGHNTAVREELARFLERLGLTVVILHEQANQGRTIIEKFEAHSDTDFAVVLLTSDDVGGAAEVKESPRARQNVVFELGYFFGRLGRGRVAALADSVVERPSDIAGLVYIALDGDWTLRLARELKAAGLPVDMNKAL